MGRFFRRRRYVPGRHHRYPRKGDWQGCGKTQQQQQQQPHRHSAPTPTFGPRTARSRTADCWTEFRAAFSRTPLLFPLLFSSVGSPVSHSVVITAKAAAAVDSRRLPCYVGGNHGPCGVGREQEVGFCDFVGLCGRSVEGGARPARQIDTNLFPNDVCRSTPCTVLRHSPQNFASYLKCK
jgi:hypothetical protein